MRIWVDQPVTEAGGTGGAKKPRVTRYPVDALLVLGGLLVLALSALPVDEKTVSGVEEGFFRPVNDLPSLLYKPLWVFMQLGNFLVVPLAALAAFLARRRRLAGGLLLGGLLTYGLAKVVKRVVTRGRPFRLLADVNIHGAAGSGLGFVSGHAAVIAALLVVAWPWLSRPARWAAVVLASCVWIGRVYVGAHLPLDIVGGAALGVAAGGVVRLLIGRPVVAEPPAEPPAEAQEAV